MLKNIDEEEKVRNNVLTLYKNKVNNTYLENRTDEEEKIKHLANITNGGVNLNGSHNVTYFFMQNIEILDLK